MSGITVVRVVRVVMADGVVKVARVVIRPSSVKKDKMKYQREIIIHFCLFHVI